MENSVLLTIVVPTYNHPEYIEYYLQQTACLDKFNIRLEIHEFGRASCRERV